MGGQASCRESHCFWELSRLESGLEGVAAGFNRQNFALCFITKELHVRALFQWPSPFADLCASLGRKINGRRRIWRNLHLQREPLTIAFPVASDFSLDGIVTRLRP